MPVHDGGRWLAPAVESILRQTYQNLELLVVDDHSTDTSLSELDCSDSRLKLIAAKPGCQGVVPAFNHGWRQAAGEFIARMDADDLALPTRLEEQLRLLESRPDISICGSCVEIFASQPIAEGNQHYQQWLNSLRSPEDIRRELFIESPMPNPGVLFRAGALRQLGGYQDTAWPEDYDLFLRADALGMSMAKPDAVLLRWREHDTRLTRTDARYSRQAFQQAKAHHLVHSRGIRQNILIWGAGPGGRLLHDLLVSEGAQVGGFVEVHPRRIGGQKRGLPVWPVDKALTWQKGMVLVAVGARGAREDIRRYLDEGGCREGSDYLFVL